MVLAGGVGALGQPASSASIALVLAIVCVTWPRPGSGGMPFRKTSPQKTIFSAGRPTTTSDSE